jgi:hypothetical protein
MCDMRKAQFLNDVPHRRLSIAMVCKSGITTPLGNDKNVSHEIQSILTSSLTLKVTAKSSNRAWYLKEKWSYRHTINDTVNIYYTAKLMSMC